jgi:hypothetical protein
MNVLNMKDKYLNSNRVRLTVTPEMAKNFLKSSLKKRDIAESSVTTLTYAINTNRWVLMPDPIMFSADGHLVNAHHRLTAVVISGKPCEFWVEYNVSDAVIRLTDTGRSRTIANSIVIETGDVLASRIQPMVNVLCMVERNNAQRLSRAIYDDCVLSFEPELRWAAKLPGKKCPAPLGAALAYAYPVNPKSVQELTDKLLSRECKDGSAASAVLYIVGDRQAIGFNRKAAFLRIIRGIEQHIKGEPVSQLKESDKGYEYFKKARQLRGLPVTFLKGQ